MEYKDILYEKKDHVACVTINRPERYNAAQPQTVHELIDAFTRCAMDGDVGVVVFTGAGEKVDTLAERPAEPSRAIYTTIGNRTIRRIGSARASAAVIFLGLLMFLPFCVAETVWREYRHLSAAAWGAVLFLGIGCSALGYLLWYAALARLSAARVAAFSYLEPLVTMTAAAALLGESAKATTVAGGVIVLVGVYLTQRRK